MGYRLKGNLVFSKNVSQQFCQSFSEVSIETFSGFVFVQESLVRRCHLKVRAIMFAKSE